MDTSYSAEQLADLVNLWCDEHRVEPANGQAGQRITERNVRYYRTLGLLDAPLSGAGQGFGEKHRLQLAAIRLLQAQGLPLNRIRELLFGRTIEDLQRIEHEGLAELQTSDWPVFRPSPRESWRVTVLDGEFLLVSRAGRAVPDDVRDRLLRVLSPNQKPPMRRTGARKER